MPAKLDSIVKTHGVVFNSLNNAILAVEAFDF
jgi:hypothetical protein